MMNTTRATTSIINTIRATTSTCNTTRATTSTLINSTKKTTRTFNTIGESKKSTGTSIEKASFNFADYKQTVIRNGSGGDGQISFLHAASKELGPPSGGNGGRGGNVYICCNKNLTSLHEIKDEYRVEDGGCGMGKGMHGKDGGDLIIGVPLGTVVKQIDTDWTDDFTPPEALDDVYRLGDPRVLNLLKHFKFRKGYVPQEDRLKMLKERIPYRSKKKPPLLDIDFTSHNQKHLVFRGGQGGYGNPHFRSPLIPGPGIAGRGIRVAPLHLEFELKTLADIGLVGLPNAGKSTLLKAVSNAHPKIANYPFTTLNPYIGTIDYNDYYSLTMADMPGIIKGASRDLGLGLRFLRHIERTKVFVYVIDISSQEPWRDLQILKEELEAYKPGLTDRVSIIAGNKADLGQIAQNNLKILREMYKIPIVPISAMHGVNVTTLTALMRQMVVKVQDAETLDFPRVDK